MSAKVLHSGGDELYTDVKHTKPLEREIIDVTLIGESVDLFMETKRSQQDKPYYMPDKKHLLEYDDPFYCEDTPEKLKLRAFLKERCNLNDERENAVFEELLYGVRSVAVQTPDVLNHLEKLGVQLRSRRDVERFTALYSAFHNTTRMPCNRGYTPDEMMQMTPPEERFKSLSLGPNIRKSLQTGEMDIEDFRKQILTMELPSEAMRFDLLKQLARHQALHSPAGKAEEGRAQRSLSLWQREEIQEVLRKMTIPLKQVIQAIEEANEAFTRFWDAKTGKTVYLADPLMTDMTEEDKALAAEMENTPERFLRFPTKYEIHQYRIIEDFIAQLSPGKAQEELAYAIRGKGAFRRFKQSVRYHGLEQRWYDYLAEAYRELAIRWCAEEGLEYTE